MWYAENVMIFPMLDVYHPDAIFDLKGPSWIECLKRTISQLQN